MRRFLSVVTLVGCLAGQALWAEGPDYTKDHFPVTWKEHFACAPGDVDEIEDTLKQRIAEAAFLPDNVTPGAGTLSCELVLTGCRALYGVTLDWQVADLSMEEAERAMQCGQAEHANFTEILGVYEAVIWQALYDELNEVGSGVAGAILRAERSQEACRQRTATHIARLRAKSERHVQALEALCRGREARFHATSMAKSLRLQPNAVAILEAQ